MHVVFYASLGLFVLLTVVLCFSILVQESKSLGLGASFGGDAGDSLFGTSTAAVLKKFTAWLGVFFLGGCILLSNWSEKIGLEKEPATPPSAVEQVQE